MTAEAQRHESITRTHGPGTPVPLIDTDVHEMLLSGMDLLPYLDAHWQRMLTDHGWNKAEFPTDYPYTLLLRDGIGARVDWVLEGKKRGTDLDALRTHLLEGEGVSIAILNGFFHVSGRKAAYEFHTALASAYNDWQIEHWLEKEPRLRGSVHVVAHDPHAAAREIDRVGGHKQMVQVFLPTVTDRQYGDPLYRPIFEAAVRNDLVVAFHHGNETQTLLGWPRYYVEWHTLAAPQAAINQLTSLICNGLFEEVPDLKVVLLETGVAWVPWLMWRLDQQYREQRQELPWLKRLPSEHMRDSVRLSTQPMSDVKPQHFAQLVEMANIDRMYMFSSDYPHYDADTEHNVLGALPVELRRRIQSQNAIETYPKLRSFAE